MEQIAPDAKKFIYCEFELNLEWKESAFNEFGYPASPKKRKKDMSGKCECTFSKGIPHNWQDVIGQQLSIKICGDNQFKYSCEFNDVHFLRKNPKVLTGMFSNEYDADTYTFYI